MDTFCGVSFVCEERETLIVTLDKGQCYVASMHMSPTSRSSEAVNRSLGITAVEST